MNPDVRMVAHADPDAFRLGFPPMDEVHAEFVLAVEALLKAPDGEVARAFADLERLTREHFEIEERWMTETEFPARECHADEHAAVLRSVVGVGERVARGEFEPTRTLAAALLDWFPAHADYMDAALAHWMCKLRFGGKPVVLRRGASATAD
jgi:hemerythrin